ncbi:MAG: hypothetical protein PHI81_07300, partial [Synergistaceae bacterium]|nr:hypothetical protein [Synergistaceae bacterium]
RSGEIVLGKKSGKASVEYMLKELKWEKRLDDEALNEILRRVKEKGTEKRGLLTEEEFTAIVSDYSQS